MHLVQLFGLRSSRSWETVTKVKMAVPEPLPKHLQFGLWGFRSWETFTKVKMAVADPLPKTSAVWFVELSCAIFPSPWMQSTITAR